MGAGIGGRSSSPAPRSVKTPRDPGGDQGVERVTITEYRANAKRAKERRRLYARINRLPNSTVREELLAIAQRDEYGER